MDYKMLADTVMFAGKTMLQAGAETFRVEDTMHRMLVASGMEKAEVLVISTAILMTITDEEGAPISVSERITERGSNLGNVCVVNRLSREYCNGERSLEDTAAELKRLCNSERYPKAVEQFCMIATVMMFTLLLGATITEAAVATVASLILIPIEMLARRYRITEFIYYMISLAGAVFIVTLLQETFQMELNREVMVAGIAMPFVPGLAVTNAIRDTLQGDYISGSARLLEACVKAAACAVGIGIGLFLGHYVMGGVL